MAMPPDKNRGGPVAKGRPGISSPPADSTTTQSLARDLDPDLWAALAVLDRILGTDQVTVVDVIPRRPA
jgi:hypothetical protein